MGQSTVLPDTTLQIRRTFSGPRERVFKAWTDPDSLKQWFGHDDTCQIPFAEVDLRVSGRYRIRIESSKGNVHQLTGIYREIKVPEKLVFTWLWEKGGMDLEETLVTIEFHETGESTTEVTLTHERFPDETSINNHRSGWQGSLDRLSRLIQAS